MAKKMTIVEQYEVIIAKAKGVLSEDEVKFLEERAELHAKKNASRKPTKAQAENEEIKAKILEVMESGKAYTVTEIQKAVGLESNQKASALVRQLKESDLVVRTVEKGKAYFAKA
jgi:DNA-binding transcriptional regulator GbsR (MarR family)